MKNFLVKRRETIPLDYSMGCFEGVIVKEITSHGIGLDIYLKDIQTGKHIYIGSVSNRDGCLAQCRSYAMNLLHNEDFCWSHWRSFLDEEEE